MENIQKFLYPLAIGATVIGILVALRRPTVAAVQQVSPGYFPQSQPSLSSVPNTIFVPTEDGTGITFNFGSTSQAGSGMGTDSATVNQAAQSPLGYTNVLPNYLTTNQSGLANYNTAPIVEPASTDTGCCHAGNGAACGNPVSLPPSFADGPGGCLQGRQTVSQSVVDQMSARIQGYSVSNGSTVYDVWVHDNLLSPDWVM